MSDNTTPFSAGEYDVQIQKTMPYYECFHESALDLVSIVCPRPRKWLDTGCGTGGFVRKALAVFPETEFCLADPSPKMLENAMTVCGNVFEGATAALDFPQNSFDVITAILSHHYLSAAERRRSTENCFRMLKPGGLYITFENIRPLSEESIPVFMKRWLSYKLANGAEMGENEHYGRFDHEYFPITVWEHIELLRETGFRAVEPLWMSYMQAGFYALK